MRAKNNVSNIDDFQMGLESGQPINHAQPLFSIISKPFGIVCQNEERKRLLLWFDELKKYSNDTLKLLRRKLNKKYQN